MICGFGLLTRELELVTRGFEIVALGFELVTRGFELMDFTFYRITSALNAQGL